MVKLTDSEKVVVEILMQEGELSTRELCEILAERINWKKNSVYGAINGCVEKGYIQKQGGWCGLIGGEGGSSSFASFYDPVFMSRDEIIEIARAAFRVPEESEMRIMELLWQKNMSRRDLHKVLDDKKAVRRGLKKLAEKDCIKKKRFGKYYAAADRDEIERRKQKFEEYINK